METNRQQWIKFTSLTPIVAPAIAMVAKVAEKCNNVIQKASKIVRPKLEALNIAESALAVAMSKLAAAEAELAEVQAQVDALQMKLDAQEAAREKLEAEAMATKSKMDAANRLINGLAGEKMRWTRDSKQFETRRLALVGDVACCAAFISYAGPFNMEFRRTIKDELTRDTVDRNVTNSEGMLDHVADFFVDGAFVAIIVRLENIHFKYKILNH